MLALTDFVSDAEGYLHTGPARALRNASPSRVLAFPEQTPFL